MQLPMPPKASRSSPCQRRKRPRSTHTTTSLAKQSLSCPAHLRPYRQRFLKLMKKPARWLALSPSSVVKPQWSFPQLRLSASTNLGYTLPLDYARSTCVNLLAHVDFFIYSPVATQGGIRTGPAIHRGGITRYHGKR